MNFLWIFMNNIICCVIWIFKGLIVEISLCIILEKLYKSVFEIKTAAIILSKQNSSKFIRYYLQIKFYIDLF